MRTNACEALGLRCTNDVDRLVLGENVRDLGLLLEEIRAEVHLLFDDAAVDWGLLDVGEDEVFVHFLLPKVDFEAAVPNAVVVVGVPARPWRASTIVLEELLSPPPSQNDRVALVHQQVLP